MEMSNTSSNSRRMSMRAACILCPKKFSSWKALYGHMRCHPERPYRGIKPPPNFRPQPPPPEASTSSSTVTEEDHEVATCLLILANGPSVADHDQSVNQGFYYVGGSGTVAEGDMENENVVLSLGQKCGICLRVFSSGGCLCRDSYSSSPSGLIFGLDLNCSPDATLLLEDDDSDDSSGLDLNLSDIIMNPFVVNWKMKHKVD
ncbi:hypothetical protein DH2020_047563 [Rehmannia glutinosa]|uniref:C2H2-type domain-containing protein n=1 Tax=Rehmannia glutinosa TaxID=99300 RepID=A0ABR0U910_REHGL